MNQSKGIILAGGLATRMFPMTKVVSKQLLPVYDKPMIYYPLSMLMLAGVREIAIIVNPGDEEDFQNLLGSGSALGLEITYIKQPTPNGIAAAYLLAEKFLNGASSYLILGDNVFIGPGLGRSLANLSRSSGAHIFLYEVENPKEYGNVELDSSGRVIKIEEKPEKELSKFAIPGLYICDNTASDRAKNIVPSKRGELEITDLLKSYMHESKLDSTELSRGTAWLDTGSPGSLYAASEYVRVLQERQGIVIGSIEEIALLNGWISGKEAESLEAFSYKSNYGQHLRRVLKNSIEKD